MNDLIVIYTLNPSIYFFFNDLWSTHQHPNINHRLKNFFKSDPNLKIHTISDENIKYTSSQFRSPVKPGGNGTKVERTKKSSKKEVNGRRKMACSSSLEAFNTESTALSIPGGRSASFRYTNRGVSMEIDNRTSSFG